MATITTRAGKGSPLTNTEVDNNFTNLNTDKLEISGGTMTGNLDVGGSVTADGLTVDGDVLLNGERDLHLVGSNPNAGTPFKYGEVTFGDSSSSQYSNHAKILSNGNYANQTTLEFHTSNNNSSPLRMKIADTGDITFFDASGNASFVYDESAGSTFNEQGADRNFRVASDSNTHMLFVDAGSNKVGINKSSPSGTLHITNTTDTDMSAGAEGHLTFEGNGYSGAVAMNATAMYLFHNSSGRDLIFGTNETERMRITGGGSVTINELDADVDFRVESDTNAHMLFVDGGSNKVKIGTSSSTSPTSVDLVVGGSIHAGYAEDIALSFQSGTYSNYYKGMSGKNPSTDSARGLHIFNYDNDSDSGINFWSGSSESASLYQIASFGAGATGEVIFNPEDLARDFRVKSDSQTHMLFVNAGANRVGVGTTGADYTGSDFVVQGRTTFKNGQTTEGKNLIVDGYVASTNDNILTIGTQRSSGGPFIGYGLGQNGTDSFWSATYDNFNGAHSVLVLNGATLEFYNDASNSLTAVGDEVTTYQRMSLGRTDTVFNGANSNTDFRVRSVNNANMLFVDAGEDRVGISTGSPSALLDVGGVGDSMKVGRITSSIRGGGAANHNWFKILDLGFLSSSFAHTAFRVEIVGSGGTSGEDVHMDFMLFKKQQGTTDRWTLKPFRKHGMDLAYKWDSSGGSDSSGLLELWIAAEGVNYQVFDVRVQDLNANPSNTASLGEWQFTNTGSETQPSGSTIVVFPLTGHQTRYTQSGLQNAQFVVNDGGEDVDFRVASDNNSHIFYIDGQGAYPNISFGASTGGGQYGGTGSNGMSILQCGLAGQYVTIQNETDSNIYLSKKSGYTSGDFINFFIEGSFKGKIKGDASGTTYNTTSDRRLKDNIEPIADGTEKLMAMKPVSHTWIADPEADAVHGFIAQEMQEIVPEAVSGDPDGEEMMGMDYGRITPVLVAALQDAHNKIMALETRLAELEAN